MKLFNKITGACGEDAACSFLKKNKYRIIKRNFRCSGGEIDIIATKGEDLIFVEVKTRASDKFGTPAEAVTYYKKQNMVKTAKVYLMQNPTDMNIRFDIIDVYGIFDGGNFNFDEINHMEGVFDQIQSGAFYYEVYF